MYSQHNNIPTSIVEIEDKSSLIKTGNILFYIALSMIIIFVVYYLKKNYENKLYWSNIYIYDKSLWILMSYGIVGLALSISLIVLASKVHPDVHQYSDKPDVAEELTKYGKRFMTMGGVFLGLNILLLMWSLSLRSEKF